VQDQEEAVTHPHSGAHAPQKRKQDPLFEMNAIFETKETLEVVQHKPEGKLMKW
jgi:hypothetical protein